MPEIGVFSELIAQPATIGLLEHFGKYKVVLTEPQCPDCEVTIFGVPQDTIVIKADFFRSPDAVFSGTRGECKRADYILISKIGNRVVVIYIELKKTKSNINEVIKQLAGAQCFISYCREIAKCFWNSPDFMDNAEHRFVSIGHTSIAKRRTRIERNARDHDQPHRMLKIDWPHKIQFNMIAA